MTTYKTMVLYARMQRRPLRGVATHVGGGVLDLLWERQPQGRQALLCGMAVDSAARRHLVSSDHYPVSARLDIADQPRRRPAAYGVENGRRGHGSQRDALYQCWRHAPLTCAPAGDTRAAHFSWSGAGAPRRRRWQTQPQQRWRRPSAMPQAAFPRQRLRQSTGEMYFSPALREAQKDYRAAVQGARADPADAVAHERCMEAKQLYTDMYKEALAEHWSSIKASVEEQPSPAKKARVAFKVVRRVLGRGRPAQSLAALREPAPSNKVATTRAESVRILTAAYAEQLAPHAPMAPHPPPAQHASPSAPRPLQPPQPLRALEPRPPPAPVLSAPRACAQAPPAARPVRRGPLSAAERERKYDSDGDTPAWPGEPPPPPLTPQGPSSPAAQPISQTMPPPVLAPDKHAIAAELERLVGESQAELASTEPRPEMTLAQATPFIELDGARDMLARASVKTAAGPDDLSGPLLRLAAQAPTFVELLRDVVNFCWCFHVLPQDWRDANVTPLPKKDAPPDEPGGYRPISVTCILARQLERVVKARYEPQLEPTLSHWQGGFRQRRSTRQQVLYLREVIGRAMRRERAGAAKREGKYSKIDPYPVVFLDIQRAFDSAPHPLLLAALYRAGLRGDALHYFSAFLSGRRFRVIAGDTIGEWAPVRAGVPQGAVLSPLLYAIFIDLAFPSTGLQVAFVTDCGELLYADDGACAPSIKATLEVRYRELQWLLDALGAWAACWGVRFSAKKSAVVWFHPLQMRSKQRKRVDERIAALDGGGELRIPYDDTHSVPIPAATEYQYLGVWLTQDLSSDRQYLHMVERVTRVSAMIRALIAPGRPPGFPVIRTLIQVMLVSRITYALPFVSLTRKQSARLNALMLQPAYSALALPRSTHRASLASFADLPTVEVLHPAECMKLALSIFATAFPADDERRAKLSNHPPMRMLARALLRPGKQELAERRNALAEAQRREAHLGQISDRARVTRLALRAARTGAARSVPARPAPAVVYSGADDRGRLRGGGLHRRAAASSSEARDSDAGGDPGSDGDSSGMGLWPMPPSQAREERGAASADSDTSAQPARLAPLAAPPAAPPRRPPVRRRQAAIPHALRTARWQSTVDNMASALVANALYDALPTWSGIRAATRPPPDAPGASWDRSGARKRVRAATATLMARRVMEEAEGADHLYGSVHAGAAFGRSRCGPRGVRMARWLGLPPQSSRDATASRRRRTVARCAAAMPSALPPYLLQRRAVNNASGKTLQLRARVLLNRSNLAGEGANIRAARSDARRARSARKRGEPPPPPAARSLICTLCSANLPETLEHVLLDCTAHLYHRTLWELALAPLIHKVQIASQSHLTHPLHALAATAADTLKLLLLASPLVVNHEILTSDEVVTALSIGDRAHVEINTVRPL